MGSAFVHITFDNKYDDPPEINVIYDDSEVILCEVYESGTFDLFDFDIRPEEITTGYYQFLYEFEMETECYEMPNSTYPVIVQFDIEKFGFMGYIKHLIFKLCYLVFRKDRYTVHH